MPHNISELIVAAIFGVVAFVLAAAILSAATIILASLAKEVRKALGWPRK